MYVDNIRIRMLVLVLAFIASLSMSFNIRQLADINYYREMATQAQEAIESLSTIRIINKDLTVKTKTVNIEELQCMAENIYFEAGSQSLAGKLAVGFVTLNRTHKPNYPKTVCGVVNQRIGDNCMFSWKCQEGKEIRNQNLWQQSKQVAYDLLSRDRKDLIDITEGATHFHNKSVKPDWKLKRVATIDDHYFYR